MTSPPAPVPAENAQEGDTVDVAGQLFGITRELGRGSFGVVFEASACDSPGSAAVAVKVSLIKADGIRDTEQHAERLLTECSVLQRLSAQLQGGSFAHRVPRYLAHARTSSSVALAMTKAPGQPLDAWLYGLDAEGKVSEANPQDYLKGRLPTVRGGHTASMGLGEACRLAADLLKQMSPVFSALQPMAFHRDVSAHNLMIDDSASISGSAPDFTMIDLGLAVEAPQWLQSWRTLDICGDPRYWSPGHWIRIFLGPEFLEREQPAFARLFRERLDHYSMGIVLLELVFGLWRGPSEETMSYSAAWVAIVQLQASWRNYWSHALSLRRALMQHKADVGAQRREILDSALCFRLSAAHKAMCDALKTAAASNLSGHDRHLAMLLHAVAQLIDPSSNLSWDEVN